MAFGELWGTLSVNDHVKGRALVAQVLLFDRLVIPVPPKGDEPENARWSRNGWDPGRQRRMLEVLGVGPDPDDLAVTVPWTRAKRDEFKTLGQNEPSLVTGAERSQLVRGVGYDVNQLRPDAYMQTRMMLSREYDTGEDEYIRSLPRTWVQGVVPAYSSFEEANAELALRLARRGADEAMAEVIGWELFVPENSDWSDERALEAAASLARSHDYRGERENFRDWWRKRVGEGAPPDLAVAELAQRAERLNSIARGNASRTTTLHTFAALGAGIALAGSWFPPAAVAGAFMALVSIGADWVLKDEPTPTDLVPAAVIADARKHLGWT